MSIPTQVIINGEWVTLYRDPHQIAAENTVTETPKASVSVDAPEEPHIGVLTRTLIRSPVIKFILPARIRHAERNDVLYITTDSVEIREAHGDYTVNQVACKDDFDSPIRAARIFGLPRESTKPDINAIIHQEHEHWQESPRRDDCIMPDDSNVTIKEEANVEEANSSPVCRSEVHAQGLEAVPLHARTIPPHILILALESGNLAFVYAVNGDVDKPLLVSVQVPLHSGQSRLDQLGERIAVDPRSRAFAVAACEGRFSLYALRPMAELARQVKTQCEIQPILSERGFEVDGSILKMEFLFPSRSDRGQVILLLVVSKLGKSRLVWYEWSSMNDLSVKPTQHILPSVEQTPLLLIPSLSDCAFILVCEKQITLFKDLLTGYPSRYVHKLVHLEKPEEPATSKRAPLWVSWARVTRNASFRAVQDGIFLCREDGIIRFIDIRNNLQDLIDSDHPAGKVATNINTAFAALDVGPTKVDLLAIGGDCNDGGLWRFSPRDKGQEATRKMSTEPDWTPMMDITGGQMPETGDSPKHGSSDTRQALYACVGKAKHGALSEIRYGLPAWTALTIDIDGATESSPLAVWAFHDPTAFTSYLFLSHPKETLLLRIRPYGPYPEQRSSEIIDSPVFDMQNRTLAARAVSGRRLIQVTEKSLRGIQVSADGVDQPKSLFAETFGNSTIVAACIGLAGFETLMVLALRRSGDVYLQLAIASDSYQALGETVNLPTPPSSLILVRFEDHILCFVTSLDGRLTAYMTDEDSKSLRFVADYEFAGDFAICEAIATFPAERQDNGDVLLTIACGLRNGSVHVLSYVKSATAYCFTLIECIAFLQTPVKVLAIQSQYRTFAVHGDDLLCSVQYPQQVNEEAVGSIHRIQVHDNKEGEWQQDSYSAVSLVENFDALSTDNDDTQHDQDHLVCVDGKSINIAHLDYSKGPLNTPRRFCIGGTPTRVIVSDRLHKLIVLSDEISEIRAPPSAGARMTPGKRALRPNVAFVDLGSIRSARNPNDDVMEIDGVSRVALANQGLVATRHFLDYRPGERFLGIREWFPKLEDKEYHMLLIHTIIHVEDASDRKRTAGRLLLLAVKELPQTLELSLKRDLVLHSPVTAVAVHPDRRSIIYCCAREICVLSLQVSVGGPKWSSPVKAQLRSSGRHITVDSERERIYVSTADESVAVFNFVGGELFYDCSDTIARHGVHHLNLFKKQIILAADLGGSITGLLDKQFQPRPIHNSLTTLFEASLPHTVTRLIAVTRPVWYREPHRNALSPSRDTQSTTSETSSAPLDAYARTPDDQAIIGTCTDGTVYQIEILPTHIWPLLRFLQNLAIRSPVICPFTHNEIKGHLDPSRSANKPEFRHIDGDILARLVDRGRETLLVSLLDRPPHRKERFIDFDNAEDRWGCLAELAHHALGVKALEYNDAGQKEELARKVMRWVEILLRSVL